MDILRRQYKITLLLLSVVLASCTVEAQPEKQEEKAKTLIDFFLRFEQQSPLVSEAVWGEKNVLPRDTANGLEADSYLDNMIGKYRPKDWCYWDGSIVKDDDGTYHMYASQWGQNFQHGKGWTKGSKAMHAVSNSLYGPYKNLGLAWPHWNQGDGHNVIGLRMHDGRYALVASEITPGQVLVSDNPYGPFELLGEFIIDPNGYYPGWGRYNELDDGALKHSLGHLANVMIILRPDGRYMMLARHCVPMISDSGILGPYKMLADKAWLGIEGIPQCKMEDPTIWYSDGLYHIVVNYHGEDRTFHLTSEDGLHNWKNRGLAYARERHPFRHKNGVIEDWYTVQRPTVYCENGEVKAFNFSVIDVHKGADGANDENGSKIIVVPFDGKAFGRHMRRVVDEENLLSDATSAPEPWQSTDIGAVLEQGKTGYDGLVNTIRVYAAGNTLDGKKDACRFVYQKKSGNIMTQAMVMSHDISKIPVEAGLMIRATLHPSAPSIVATISKDKTFELKQRSHHGQPYTVIKKLELEAPYYIRFDTKEKNTTCYLSSSNRKNWTEIATLENTFDNEFYIGTVTASGDGQTAFTRFKDVDVHEYGHPKNDRIVMHTFPDTISSSGKIEFEVEIESVRTSDIWVELECVQTHEKFKALRKRFWKSGKQKLEYDAGKPLNPNYTYWVVLKAVQMHFHDSEHHDACFKKVFVHNDKPSASL